MRELEFGSVIGRGSFAVVYRGCWQGKDVALKQIRVPCGNIATMPKEVSILRLANILPGLVYYNNNIMTAAWWVMTMHGVLIFLFS